MSTLSRWHKRQILSGADAPYTDQDNPFHPWRPATIRKIQIDKESGVRVDWYLRPGRAGDSVFDWDRVISYTKTPTSS